MYGRLSYPLFAFQLAVGYFHSKNKEKHIFKMLLFAICSQIPFMFFINEAVPDFGPFLNIGFTFTIALLGMYVYENIKQPILKILLIAFVLFLGNTLPIDYGVFGVSLCISFYILYTNKILSTSAASVLIILKALLEQSPANFAMLFTLVPICLYNGKKGKNIKNFFYFFYPLHMIVFVLIHRLI